MSEPNAKGPILDMLKSKVAEAIAAFLAKYTIEDLINLFIKKSDAPVFGSDSEAAAVLSACEELSAAEAE